jgi:acyl carrier protein
MERNLIKSTLAEIFERSTGESVCNIEESMNLKTDLSLDSIDVVTVAIEVQCEFKIELKTAELMKLVLVKDLIDLIQSKATPAQSRAA